MPTEPSIATYLDESGRVVGWPSKRNRRGAQRLVLAYLASKFEHGRDYREREVNEILRAWHTFDDHALLRRELFEAGLLLREKDGSRYWRP